MAICPFAVQKLLPENSTQNKIIPRAIILHTAVDSSIPNSSIYGYFSRGDVGDESHFYVMDNGTIEQYIDTERRADANVSANGFAISIETEDDGHPEQNAWTSKQIAAIKKLIDWLCSEHNIPHRQIESTTGSGIGWHSMWGVNTPTHKINPWTSAVGKTCPGGPRIAQMNEIIGGFSVDEKTIATETLDRDLGEIVVYNRTLADAARIVNGAVIPIQKDVAEIKTMLKQLLGTGINLVSTGEIVIKAETSEQA